MSERSRPVTGCPLTGRELEVVELVRQGLTHKQIALKLGINHSTVRTHLHNAYVKLDAHGSAQAVLRCEREGWIAREPAKRSRSETVLEEIRTILTACLAQLEQGTRHRVTRSQYAYLKAFDAFLRSPGHAEDESMRRALGAVLSDAEVIPSGHPRHGRHRSAEAA